MRIGLFLESLHDAHGGAFQQALSIIECLMRKNTTKHDFVVFTPLKQTRQFLLKEESRRYKSNKAFSAF